MLWITAIIIGLFLGIFIAYSADDSIVGAILLSILCTIGTFLFTFLLALISSTGTIPTERAELVNTTEIVAMNDNIGAGGYYRNIDTEGKLWVLTKTEKGAHMTDYNASKTYIQETDGTPRVETYKKIPVSCLRTFLFTKSLFETTEYIIFVPKEAEITDNFVVDLE